jgi:hypothetical protein
MSEPDISLGRVTVLEENRSYFRIEPNELNGCYEIRLSIKANGYPEAMDTAIAMLAHYRSSFSIFKEEE